MKITVGITAYNCERYLIDAINSLINQNTNNWFGILVLDGGANLATKQIYQKFNHPKFKKFEFKTNQGPFVTRSKAIELSETDWYVQLDGDDLLPQGALASIEETVLKNPKAEFIYGNCEYFSSNNAYIKYPSFNSDDLVKGPLFNAVSPININMFRKIGGFSNELFINADWDFWLSVYEKKICGHYTNTLLYKRRNRVNNIGSIYIDLRPQIIKLIIKRHPFFFNTIKRKNDAKFNVFEKMARYYKAIGCRNRAAKYAEEALKYTKDIHIFDAIFEEKKMSIIRYYFRRIGRKIK
ncbi:MAG: hypothetical protein CMD13_02660 [Flavobacteriales bacterium]|nr:hypothetical protein [Flavobacteriales bacterium]|tara:strand:+ start:508 stop:1395 length:888 start_codon:yes stop_codon:yes gene_type:complete